MELASLGWNLLRFWGEEFLLSEGPVCAAPPSSAPWEAFPGYEQLQPVGWRRNKVTLSEKQACNDLPVLIPSSKRATKFKFGLSTGEDSVPKSIKADHPIHHFCLRPNSRKKGLSHGFATFFFYCTNDFLTSGSAPVLFRLPLDLCQPAPLRSS